MSKYRQRGDYHFRLFEIPGDHYREHVLDLLRVVPPFIKEGGTIFEAGAGEGLILSKFAELGFQVLGCDTDQWAVDLARGKGIPVSDGRLQDCCSHHKFDAVFLLDALEHMEDWKEVVELSTNMADVIVIALPDREDPHAVEDPEDILVMILSGFEDAKETWERVHLGQRHARHVAIFKRKAESSLEPDLEEHDPIKDLTGCDA